MNSLRELVRRVLSQSPALRDNPKHLILTVWERQGLKLYPHQREAILSDALSSPEAITRAARRTKREIEEAKKRYRFKIRLNSEDNKTIAKKTRIP